MHAESNAEAWAVGSETTSGKTSPLLLQWDGSGWSQALMCKGGKSGGLVCGHGVDLMGESAALSSVYVVEGEVWVVGSVSGKGAVWSIRGGLLTQEYLDDQPDTQLNKVWWSGKDNAWAVGFSGTILKWNAMSSTWVKQTSGTTNGLNSVWGSDKDNVWAVGETGTILKWNTMSSTWATQTSGTTSWLYSVWGSDKDNLWAVGEKGTILKWNGSTWARQTSGTTNHLSSVWGSDKDNLWAAGSGGTILKWNGSTWATQTSPRTEWLSSVWGSDKDNLWAVGEKGTILKWEKQSPRIK